MLWRNPADGASLAAGAGAYGGSQAGAVLRYRLAPGSRWQPAAFVRLTSALGGFIDRQAALGLAVRPIAALPVAVQAEARVQQGSVATRVRPALVLVGGIGPKALAGRFEIESFGQAGWVGGADHTAFFDLQATVQRRLLQNAVAGDLALGVGAWSGGQQGAARLDLGPRLQWRVAPGGVPLRIALDWRLRVAGHAQPGNGPALTVSSGF